MQPAPEAGATESPGGKNFPLRRVGCAGRLMAFTENDDGRYVISLAGIARFLLGGDVATDQPFRICAGGFRPLRGRFRAAGTARRTVDRPRLLTTLKSYLEANNLNADWDRINNASNERLVNTSGDPEPLRARGEAVPARGAGLRGARRGAGRARRDGARRARRRLAGHRYNEQDQTEGRERRLDPKLLEILVCPLTKTSLDYDAERQELISRAAGLAYPIRDGIPIMLPEEARKLDQG